MLSKKTMVMGGLLALLLLVFAGAYTFFKPAGSSMEKSVQVTVVYRDQTSDRFTITTEEEFLRGALEEIGLIEGDESDYGLFVKTVNGVTVDESRNEWWCFTQQGEELYTGVDTTPITDGGEYEISLTSW